MPRNSTPIKPTPKVSLPLPPPVLYQPRPHSLMGSMSRPAGPVSPPSLPANSLLNSVKDGFGLGIGASLGRSLVDNVFGNKPPAPQAIPTPPNNTQTSPQSSGLCSPHQFAFDSCIRSFPSDITTCQSQLDSLNRCLSAPTNRNGTS